VLAFAGIGAFAYNVLSDGTPLASGAPTRLEYQGGPPLCEETIVNVPGGTFSVGAVATVFPEVLTSGKVVFKYSWSRWVGATKTVIAGATKQSYKIQAADLGANLQASAIVKDHDGTSTCTSGQSGPVVERPVLKVAPKLTGNAVVGQQLTVSNGTWVGTATITFAYAWLRCSAAGTSCGAIGGAASNAYTPTSDDKGHRLKAAVTAHNAYGDVTATTAATKAVLQAPANTSVPTISGIAANKKKLTAAPGTWTGSAPIAFAYAWKRCDSGGNSCVQIAGGTSKTYVVKAADIGHTLRVAVTGKNAAGSATATSAATVVVS
jgi:fibronectin-binding autotransporter adhesin